MVFSRRMVLEMRRYHWHWTPKGTECIIKRYIPRLPRNGSASTPCQANFISCTRTPRTVPGGMGLTPERGDNQLSECLQFIPTTPSWLKLKNPLTSHPGKWRLVPKKYLGGEEVRVDRWSHLICEQERRPAPTALALYRKPIFPEEIPYKLARYDPAHTDL